MNSTGVFPLFASDPFPTIPNHASSACVRGGLEFGFARVVYLNPPLIRHNKQLPLLTQTVESGSSHTPNLTPYQTSRHR